MISIFMSPFNVHANWFPVDGQVKSVKHHNGNFHKAWLPKASEENERADVLITTPDGTDVLCRQIACKNGTEDHGRPDDYREIEDCELLIDNC